jgi:hypothetical protein
MYQLTLTIARVLEVMVDSEVKGLNRVNLHEPLCEYGMHTPERLGLSLKIILAAFGVWCTHPMACRLPATMGL